MNEYRVGGGGSCKMIQSSQCIVNEHNCQSLTCSCGGFPGLFVGTKSIELIIGPKRPVLVNPCLF